MTDDDSTRRELGQRPTVELPPDQRGKPPPIDVPRELEAGATIGRFVVIERLGAGGMGVVYKAHDPELDRRIAIKLLRLRRSDVEDVTQARARLLREAQALAKLSHPNVIAIHDVGTHEDDVFLAMELVEGTTLRRWLAAEQRTEQQIVGVYLAAGHGLTAAHAAGLVHRDFKPDNVMVGDDGRVRVLDFGLARPMIAAEPRTKLESSGEKRLDTPLTVEGTVMGTPAYMAPEQHAGGVTDARTDQFSFCLALCEALTGKRPPPGEVDDAALPAWLRRSIVRGMSEDPDQRYPDMEPLLAELGRDPRAKRRRWLLVAAATVLVGAAAGGMLYARAPSIAERCEADLAGVWDPSIAAKLAVGFAATGRGHAVATYDRLAKQLGTFRADWVGLHAKSCADTARGTQSDRLLDVRATCLERRADELRALITVLATEPTGDVVDHAVEAVASVATLERCRDNEALVAATPLPTDAATRTQVIALQSQLDRVGALDKAGKVRNGLELAKTAAATARTIAYLPVQVVALERLAELHEANGHFDDAERLYYEVTKKAGEAKDDLAGAEAAIHLVAVVGRVETRKAEALALASLAEAAIARAGNDDVKLAGLELNVGMIEHRLGKYDEALAHWQRALQVSEKQRKDPLQIAMILSDLGIVLGDMGKNDDARRDLERSLALYDETLGADHPSSMIPLTNLANVALKQGKLDEAERFQRHALALAERSLPPDHPDVAAKINNLALIYQARGDFVHAQHEYERVLAMYERAMGPNDPTVGIVVANIGESLALQHKPAAALASYERAMAIWTAALGADHPMMAYGLTGAGKANVELGKPQLAIDQLQRALAIREHTESEPLLVAETRFQLARALWDAKRDPHRAVELATRAQKAFAAGGDPAHDELVEATTWLEHHH